MKKLMIALLSFIFSALLFFPRPASAEAGMSVGAYSWFAWWNPIFEKMLTDKDGMSMMVYRKTIKKSFSMDPAPMGGAQLSFDLNDKINWSNIIVIGKYKAQARSFTTFWSPIFPVSGLIMPDNNTFSFEKYDLDSTLNFALKKYLKFFIGLRYQHYKYKYTGTAIFGSFPNYLFFVNNIDIAYHAGGIGFGLAFTFHLVENLFLIWNLSGVYQKPFFLYSGSGLKNYMWQNMGTFIPLPIDNHQFEFHQGGANTALIFAYYIEKISLTVALGGRYQYLHMFGENADSDANWEKVGGEDDHIYGITLSAVYSFNFGK